MSTDASSAEPEDAATEPETEPDTESESEPEPETKADDTPDLTTEPGGFACKGTVAMLESFFEQYTPILDEIKLHLEPDGFEAIGVDPANVGSVDQRLDAQAFEHYSATGGLIGLDLSRITDILSIGGAGDPVRMELDQETRKLELVIDGLEYTLALIDPDTIRQEPSIPDLELSAEVTIGSKDLNRAVTAAEMVSNHVRFKTGQTDDGEDAFLVEAEGDTDDVHLELTRDELVDLEMGEADSLFSLDYLKDLNKAIPSNTDVTLELGEEFPAFIRFEHIEGDSDDQYHAEVMQMLAPRISSED